MSFKDISYLEFWKFFCSAERNHLCNSGRRHHEDQFCEIILKLDLWFRCHLEDFLSRALVAPVFSGTEPFMQFCRGHYGGIFM